MARNSGRVRGCCEDDTAQGGGAEDEELREAELFGFGLAPFAEALVEVLLLGAGEVDGGKVLDEELRSGS